MSDASNYAAGVGIALISTACSAIGLVCQKLTHKRLAAAAAASAAAASASADAAAVSEGADEAGMPPARDGDAVMHSTVSMVVEEGEGHSEGDSLTPTHAHDSNGGVPPPAQDTGRSHSSTSSLPPPALPSLPHGAATNGAAAAIAAATTSAAAPSRPTKSSGGGGGGRPRHKRRYYADPLWLMGIGGMLAGALLSFLVFNYLGQSRASAMASITIVWNAILASAVLGERFTLYDGVVTGVIVGGATVAVVFGAAGAASQSSSDLAAVVEQLSRQIVWVAGPVVVVVWLAGDAGVRYLAAKGPRRSLLEVRIECYMRIFLSGIMTGVTGMLASSVVKSLGGAARGTGGLPVASSYQFWLMLFSLPASLVLQLGFLNSALAQLDALEIVPPYQAAVIIIGLLWGWCFTGDADGASATSLGLFALGCLISCCGVLLLAFKRKLSPALDRACRVRHRGDAAAVTAAAAADAAATTPDNTTAAGVVAGSRLTTTSGDALIAAAADEAASPGAPVAAPPAVVDATATVGSGGADAAAAPSPAAATIAAGSAFPVVAAGSIAGVASASEQTAGRRSVAFGRGADGGGGGATATTTPHTAGGGGGERGRSTRASTSIEDGTGTIGRTVSRRVVRASSIFETLDIFARPAVEEYVSSDDSLGDDSPPRAPDGATARSAAHEPRHGVHLDGWAERHAGTRRVSAARTAHRHSMPHVRTHAPHPAVGDGAGGSIGANTGGGSAPGDSRGDAGEAVAAAPPAVDAAAAIASDGTPARARGATLAHVGNVLDCDIGGMDSGFTLAAGMNHLVRYSISRMAGRRPSNAGVAPPSPPLEGAAAAAAALSAPTAPAVRGSSAAGGGGGGVHPPASAGARMGRTPPQPAAPAVPPTLPRMPPLPPPRPPTPPPPA